MYGDHVISHVIHRRADWLQVCLSTWSRSSPTLQRWTCPLKCLLCPAIWWGWVGLITHLSPPKFFSSYALSYTFLSYYLQAQAQELLWEKTVMEGLKKDLSSLIDYAHRTKSVAECYKPVRELIDEDTLKEYLPGCWITLIKVSHAYFEAIATPTFILSMLSRVTCVYICIGEGRSLQSTCSLLRCSGSRDTGRHIQYVNQEFNFRPFLCDVMVV